MWTNAFVRIATGRDAADCAFLSYYGGYVGLKRLHVDAWVVPDGVGEGLEMLPGLTDDAVPAASDPSLDDFGALVQIA